MSKQKHTPGPWKLRYARKSTDLPYEVFAPESLEFKLRPLARIDSNGPNGEHYFANACLIEAAPDLLEALGVTASALEGVASGFRYQGNQEMYEFYLGKSVEARKAIAKAQGGE